MASVRAFNRWYTKQVGLLDDRLVDTPYSLTEARVLFELAQHDVAEVVDLRTELDLDPGYLSRILGRFERDGLVTRVRSATDGRRQVVRLTRRGRSEFTLLDRRTTDQIDGLLAPLSARERSRLLGAMAAIEKTFDPQPASPSFVLRPPGPGDLGWVVARHGERYAEEYGWDESFEVLVARIVADFGADHDPRRERAWIAEVDGEPAGSVFCVRREQDVAQLRLLLVEPFARGMGIGSRLVDECIRFARRSGYTRMMLWTNDVLVAARRLYERAGFVLATEEPHHSYGRDLVGQDWWLDLR